MLDSLWFEYGWTLLILIGLEGILSADNALVIAVIAKHLPAGKKKLAINYGIIIAFIFRFAALFTISFLVNVWQVQAIGAVYLIYLSVKHVIFTEDESEVSVPSSKGFWPTVGKIGVTDLVFAIDSILAAVTLAATLPATPLPQFGGMDGAQFAIVIAGGVAGLILIKYAAGWFILLLEKRPGLEKTAYVIVGWVGVKLAVITLAQPAVGILSEHFPRSSVWEGTFWSVLLFIAVSGWFLSGKENKPIVIKK